MTPQERDVIAGIFNRLRQAENQPRDPEAERFIADRIREQPYAPYAMAQAVYVQEQALTNLQAQLEQAQAEIEQLRNRPAPAQPAQQGGFLSGIFGGGAQAPAAPARAGSVPSFPQRAASGLETSPPWGGQAAAAQQAAPGPWQNQQQPPARAGGGFMATALTTAAGVAGGMMLGNVLTNAFGGGKSGEAKAAETASTDGGSSASAQPAADTQQPEPAQNDYYQDAGYSEPYDDGSSGFGGDDGDWT